MARQVNKLTARAVQTLSRPGKHADGGGLYLIIDSSGSKRWALIYQVANKRREKGLGGVGSVSLAEAREKAAEARRMIASGQDPVDASQRRSKAPPPKFSEVATAFMADNAPAWKSAVHRHQWAQTLTDHAAHLWGMPVDQIETDDVLKVLRPLWQDKPETATRLRGRIERVLDAARASGHRSGENPARWRGHLSALLPKAKKLKRGHHAAMPYRDVPAFMARLAERDADAARMLEVVILTAARHGEVRSMEWGEVDFAARLWTVPAIKMKASRPHRVPMTPRVVEILMARHSPGASGLVFPSGRGKPYSDPVFIALYRRMGVAGITTHGFRSAFKDWATDTTHHQREIIEAALAHVIGDQAEQAYRRTDAIEKRRSLLHDWAAFLLGGTGDSEAKKASSA